MRATGEGVEEIIRRILALRPGLTREAVERLIDEERAKAAGLLTREAAAHLVASALGVEGAGEAIEAKMRIGGLTSGLNDVSVTGRVIHVYPSRSFTRSDGREGKVLRMLLGDSTGVVSVVFWDERADQVEGSGVGPGRIIRVLHGYTRERYGEVELNVGRRGTIYLEPLDAASGDYPPVESFFREPGEIGELGLVNLTGVVVDRTPPSVFIRRDGGEGRVARLTLAGGGGRIGLVLWNDWVERLGDVEEGTRLRVVRGRARRRMDGSLEVHLGADSGVQVVERGVEVERWMKLGDLKPGMRGVDVVARVAEIGDVREFQRSDGSRGRVASLLLEDETGRVRMTLWDDEVELLREVEVGDVIVVEDGYTRGGPGPLSLSLGSRGRVEVNPEGVEAPPSARGTWRIGELREGMENVSVEGRVVDEPEIREVETARGPVKLATLHIEDDTGRARVSLWRDLADEAEGLKPGDWIRIENCSVRPPFREGVELSSGMFTRIIRGGGEG
ncbi:MAG: Replication factor A (ssDNA-binding protein) [Candidatus Bathyarchaeota archaeon B23]|nr:MAG: Replication factor A (ssDNA-binding protein) [Candidatus Bathyarchaeota archaeon B23]